MFVDFISRHTYVKTTYKTFAVWVGFMKKVFGRRNNVRQQKILLNKWNIFLYSWRPSHAISKSNEKFSLFFLSKFRVYEGKSQTKDYSWSFQLLSCSPSTTGLTLWFMMRYTANVYTQTTDLLSFFLMLLLHMKMCKRFISGWL